MFPVYARQVLISFYGKREEDFFFLYSDTTKSYKFSMQNAYEGTAALGTQCLHSLAAE